MVGMCDVCGMIYRTYVVYVCMCVWCAAYVWRMVCGVCGGMCVCVACVIYVVYVGVYVCVVVCAAWCVRSIS